ncbi:M20 family metallopeptidase [Brevibacterium senegalense]|uniref:M20 family metallopeptidase n=1 Tax=Brevibacterium senegalense TaxID=1033736 RepID=UPI000363F12B|nr:M20 family metallopeptidase [Brevibacterium senegalense]
MRFSEEKVGEFLEDFRTLVECESPSSDPQALASSARLVAEIGERITGIRPSISTIEGYPHVLFHIGTGPRRVLLVGHHDTVWPRGTLATMPWSVTGERVSGPGTDDMKGGILIALHAVGALVREKDEEELDGITVLITADEELGSPTSQPLIERLSREAEAVLVFESGGTAGQVKIARKGVAIYSLEVVGRAAHAGVEPERGVNAAVEAAHQILAIEALGDTGGDTTVVPAVTRAGTTTNTVPARARIGIDSRALTSAEQQRVDRALRDLEPRHPESQLVLHGGINRPPLEEETARALFARAQETAAQLGHPPLEAVRVGGGSDANFAAGMGAPTLDGLGTVGGGSHADDEHALLTWIPRRIELTASLVASLLRAPVPRPAAVPRRSSGPRSARTDAGVGS